MGILLDSLDLILNWNDNAIIIALPIFLIFMIAICYFFDQIERCYFILKAKLIGARRNQDGSLQVKHVHNPYLRNAAVDNEQSKDPEKTEDTLVKNCDLPGHHKNLAFDEA